MKFGHYEDPVLNAVRIMRCFIITNRSYDVSGCGGQKCDVEVKAMEYRAGGK